MNFLTELDQWGQWINGGTINGTISAAWKSGAAPESQR